MIRLTLLSALAIPLFVSGCVIIDADERPDYRNISVLHDEGKEVEAFQQADAECGAYGMDAKLIDVDDASAGGQVRSLFLCY